MIVGEYLGMQFRLATVVVPVAVYFLILGLLNSRRHPKLLSARQDFVLLMAALSPLFILPALSCLSLSWAVAIVAIAVVAAATWLLVGSGGNSWVIYNLPYSRALSALEMALSRMGEPCEVRGRDLLLGRGRSIHVSSFPLLRNVSLRLRGCDRQFADQLSAELSRCLAGMEVQTPPMAVGLLMVALAMLVIPAAMVVHRAPQIVRIITDLLQ